MRFHELTLVAVFSAALIGCSSTPGIAPKGLLPLEAITFHAVCELQDALSLISDLPEKRRPKNWPYKWGASIKITPTMETDINPAAGLTGTSKGPNSNTFFNTWESKGNGLDFKANTQGTTTIYVHLGILMDKDNTLRCKDRPEDSHVLAQDLGIREWIKRQIEAADNPQLGAVGSSDKISSPTVDWQILDQSVLQGQMTLKISGGASLVYNAPFGTNIGGLSAYYSVDEKVSIAFAEDKSWLTCPTRQFPTIEGGKDVCVPKKPKESKDIKGNKLQTIDLNRETPGQLPDTLKQRLDTIQLEQTIRNLQFRP